MNWENILKSNFKKLKWANQIFKFIMLIYITHTDIFLVKHNIM